MVEAGDYFFLWCFGTIVFTRFLLIERKTNSPVVGKLQMHHYMYGVVLMIVAFIFSHFTLYAIGAGLFIDEIPQMVTRRFKTWEDYYSVSSLMALMAIILLVYIFRVAIASLMVI